MSADRSESGGSAIAVPTLLLGLIAAVSYYFLPAPLTGSRAPEQAMFEAPIVAEQTIPARLWQDPFQAIAAARNVPGAASESTKDVGIDQLRQQALSRIAGVTSPEHLTAFQADNKVVPQLLILPVMIPGGRDAADAETRIRSRYAVISGLGRAGFVPEAQEFIGCATFGWPRLHAGEEEFAVPGSADRRSNCLADLSSLIALIKSEHKAPPEQTLPVPYEWFRFDKSKSMLRRPAVEPPLPSDGTGGWVSHVLVLWVNDDEFSDNPLTRLAYLYASLGAETRDQATTKSTASIERSKRTMLRILGPASSTTLERFLDDDVVGDSTVGVLSQSKVPPPAGIALTVADELAMILQKAQIYSSRPTADRRFFNGRLEGDDQDDSDRPSSAEPRIWSVPLKKRCAIQVYRTGGTDGRLAEAIKAEIAKRGLHLAAGKGQRIAIISEWDSLYGRALPRSFETVFGKNVVLPFSYLRGLDGLGKAASDRAGSEEKSSGTRVKPDEDEVRPDGPRQLDYARRIASQLGEIDRHFEVNGGAVAAVGIVGSDAYDKLLILRALREELPHALFFTTDLDNRFLDAREREWTKNLIVASEFGLTLHASYQREFPPFRDSYQTALFYSTYLALQPGAPAINEEVPRIFEVGRYTPVDLTPVEPLTKWPPAEGLKDDGAVAADPPARAFVRPRSIHPTRIVPEFTRFASTTAIVLLASSLLVLLASFTSESVAALMPWYRTRSWPCAYPPHSIIDRLGLTLLWVVTIAVSVFFALRIYDDQLRTDYEPFSLTEGVSIWPGECLRAVSVLLTVWFSACGFVVLKRNQSRLTQLYFLPELGSARRSPKPRASKAPPPQVMTKSGFKAAADSGFAWIDLRAKRLFSLGSWHCSPLPLSAGSLWAEYCNLSRLRPTLYRVAAFAGLYIIFGRLLFELFPMPSAPTRGGLSGAADAILRLAYIPFVLVTCYVADATRLCQSFGRKLQGKAVPWGLRCRRHFAQRENAHEDDIAEWLDVRLIVERTEPIVWTIFPPFILLTLMILSRSSFFDRWSWPPSLIVILVASCLYAAVSAVRLHAAAETARQNALENLRSTLRRLDDDIPRAHRIKLLIDEIESMDGGALRPWGRHPLVAAVLLPAGGVGTWAIVGSIIAGR